MKSLLTIISYLLLTSCSSVEKVVYPGGKEAAKRSVSSTRTCDSEEDRLTIKKSIEAKSYVALQEALAECDLTDQFYLHNYLSRSRGRKEELVSISQFFLDKGASPKELDLPNITEEDKKREINISILSLHGPLQTVLSSGNEALTEFYLKNMSKEDIAKGSLGFRGTTIDDLMFFEERYKDSDNYILSHVLNAPRIYKAVDMALQKNSLLCKEGNDSNCKAERHLKLELASMHQGIIDIAKYKACSSQTNLKDHDELMQKQMELGKKTGMTAPETYDYHAREVQKSRKALKAYKKAYHYETNNTINMNFCE